MVAKRKRPKTRKPDSIDLECTTSNDYVGTVWVADTTGGVMISDGDDGTVKIESPCEARRLASWLLRYADWKEGI